MLAQLLTYWVYWRSKSSARLLVSTESRAPDSASVELFVSGPVQLGPICRRRRSYDVHLIRHQQRMRVFAAFSA